MKNMNTFRHLLIAALILSATSLLAQQRTIGATALELDDNAGNTILVKTHTSGWGGNLNFVLPVPPIGSVRSGFVHHGTSPDQTTRFDGNFWVPTNILLNDGSNLTVGGNINPDLTGTRNLGSPALRFGNIYADNIIGALSPSSLTLPLGNIIVGNVLGQGSAVPPGASNTILSINGSGVPTWQTLGTVGGLSGSGTATQVAFFSGATTLSSSPNLFWNNTTGSLGIGGAPTASSALSINSTTQGFLAPRMDLSERNLIGSPATGLLIYQTDNNPGFYYYNGSQWVSLVPSSGGVGSILFKRKTANQAVVQNGVGSTIANDNDLFFTVGADEAWEFEVVGYLSSANNSILSLAALQQAGINLSNAASAAGFIVENLNVSALGIVGSGLEGVRTQNGSTAGDHLNTFLSVNLGVALTPVSDTYVKLKGFVKATGTPTTVTVRWNNVISVSVGAGSSTLTIEPNSYLKAIRVE
jgi:hypothetical protein